MRMRAVSLAATFVVALALSGTPVLAHPSDDIFTVNVYARVEPYGDRLRLLYLVDLAEVPSHEEIPKVDTDQSGLRRPLLRGGERLSAVHESRSGERPHTRC